MRFDPRSSTFKRRLLDLKPGERMFAAHLSSDFVLPRDVHQKLAFVAGGIGVTPFASMIRQLLRDQDKRPIVVLYSASTPGDIAYADLLDDASEQLGIRIVYTLTDPTSVPADFRERTFYLSGSQRMVSGVKEALKHVGVSGSRVKTDYFPGYD